MFAVRDSKLSQLFECLDRTGRRRVVSLEEFQDLPEPRRLPFSPMVWLLLLLLLYRKRHPLGRRLFEKLPSLDSVRQKTKHKISGTATHGSCSHKAAGTSSFLDHLRDWTTTTLPWTPAIRVFEGHPECADIRLAVAALRICKFIEMFDFPSSTSIVDGFRPTSRAQRWGCIAGSVYSDWRHPEMRAWLAASAGDWLLALELAKTTCEPDIVKFIERRVEEYAIPLYARDRKDMNGEARWHLGESLSDEPDYTQPLWGGDTRSTLLVMQGPIFS